MQFSRLCEYFDKIDQTSKRLEKTELLRQIIGECEANEVAQALYIALGELKPKYDRLEFNLADKMIVRAIASSTNQKIDEIAKLYKEGGDLGEVAEKVLSQSVNPSANSGLGQLSSKSVEEVYEELTRIAEDSGMGSQERKVTRLAKILKNEAPNSAKYIVRMVLGKLRLGFADKTILDALSYVVGNDKSAREELENLYQVAPDVGELARIVKQDGLATARANIKIKLGRPIQPALAQRLPTAKEMIEKMGKVMAEPKFDGTRVQIHYKKRGFETISSALLFEVEKVKQVKTFTRNLDENSEMFPELARIGEQLEADELILDSEAVGYDPKSGKMLPFQMTITRKRKHGVEEASLDVPLKFFIFDVLYINGESLINLPLHERRRILEQTVNKKGLEDVLVTDEYIVTEDPQELKEFHKKKLEEGLEGVVIKQFDGKYVPGRQGFNWVKFKEEEGQTGKLSDTLDVVVMGYYRGKGKRTDFGIGAFLVGIRGEGEEIVTIAKIGTGLTDEQFREIKEKLLSSEIRDNIKPDEYLVDNSLYPDVWTEPNLVVEVAADEITISPTHSSGYALRFPRVVKFRDDKSKLQITGQEELKGFGVKT